MVMRKADQNTDQVARSLLQKAIRRGRADVANTKLALGTMILATAFPAAAVDGVDPVEIDMKQPWHIESEDEGIDVVVEEFDDNGKVVRTLSFEDIYNIVKENYSPREIYQEPKPVFAYR